MSRRAVARSAHAQPRELPMLFRPRLVRAILQRLKTQTRRALLPQPSMRANICVPFPEFGRAEFLNDRGRSVDDARLKYFKGDRVWVRETWAVDAELEQVRRELEDALSSRRHGPYYLADEEEETGLRWRPSIHMPRWACRLQLEVLADERVERLQDITDDDARAEGIDVYREPSGSLAGLVELSIVRMRSDVRYAFLHGPLGVRLGARYTPRQRSALITGEPTPAQAFAVLWHEFNWARLPLFNPWLRVIEFRAHPLTSIPGSAPLRYRSGNTNRMSAVRGGSRT